VHGVELILVLLGAVTLLAAISDRTSIPFPIFLVLGGLALGLIPGVPAVHLDPEFVFLFFLPPMIACITKLLRRSGQIMPR
jgi:monovalent cation/hydrogen antiporter